MLIRRKTDEGVWHTLRVRGEEILLLIRPLTADVVEKIRAKHKRVTKERDPQTRQMVSSTIYDEESVLLDMIDHMLAGFEGIGDESGQPLDPTPENKKWVMNIPAVGNEQSIADFVFEQARALAVIKSEEAEAQAKN